jgi:hypothetical protein
LATLLCAAAGLATGCGSASTPATPPPVQVSLLAPTDGATVIQSRITVLGTIVPGTAALRVSGKRVLVRHGSFSTPMFLRKGITRIRIRASARGFVPSSRVISVRYTPRKAPPLRAGGATAGGGSIAGSGSIASSESLVSGGSGSSLKADMISSCSTQGDAAYCECIIDRLWNAGYSTLAKWQAVVVNWRQTFQASGTITYPPVMKQAIVTCLSQSG